MALLWTLCIGTVYAGPEASVRNTLFLVKYICGVRGGAGSEI